MLALENILRRTTPPGASVLEVGCGSGYNSVFIQAIVGGDVSYAGIDTAHAMIALAEASQFPGCAFDELCRADPAFAASQDNRSRIEWYFTAALPHYLLSRFPGMPRLTYLDANLLFYCSPEPLHREAQGASVQIIEHRFSDHLVPLIT